MRSLGTARYTDLQVDAALKARNLRAGARFEILDDRGRKVGNIASALAMRGAHIVERNMDREIQGSLDMVMLPDERLRSGYFRYRIRPWYRIVMPDGVLAEWPMGSYLWIPPARTITRRGQEVWRIAGMPDLTYGLMSSGPGPMGLRIDAGANIVDTVKFLLAYLGFTDLTGIVPSPREFDQTRTWMAVTPRGGWYDQRQQWETQLRSLESAIETNRENPDPDDIFGWKAIDLEEKRGLTQWALAIARAQAPDNETQPVSWLALFNRWLTGIGYNPLWVDFDDRPRVEPAVDLRVVQPNPTYSARQDSVILSPLTTTPKIDGWANRITAKASNTDGLYGAVTVDANDYHPGHPFSQGEIGFHKDDEFDNPFAQTLDDLRASAEWALAWRLNLQESVQIKTMANPAHEAYEFPGLRIDGDPVFGAFFGFAPTAPIVFGERMHALDLYTSEMDHGWSQMYRP